MKRYIAAFAAVPALVLLLAAACAANPWALGEDHFRVALTSAWTVSNSVYDNGGTERPLPGDIKRVDVLVSYKTGFSNGTELSIETGYTTMDPEFAWGGVLEKNNSGAADTWIRHKWQFRNQGLDAALLSGVKIPGAYNRNMLNASGDAQTDLELGLSAGQHMAGSEVYWNVDAIYRWRLSNPANEVEYCAQLGRVFADRFDARVAYSKIDSLGGYGLESTPWGGGAQRFTGMETDSDTLGAGLEYRFNQSRALALTYSDTLGGKNVLDGATLGIAFSFSH